MLKKIALRLAMALAAVTIVAGSGLAPPTACRYHRHRPIRSSARSPTISARKPSHAGERHHDDERGDGNPGHPGRTNCQAVVAAPEAGHGGKDMKPHEPSRATLVDFLRGTALGQIDVRRTPDRSRDIKLQFAKPRRKFVSPPLPRQT